jgi:hypothetical protein
MAQLTFSGRSDDGERLLLVDDEGQEHTLVIDARLRDALRADAPGTGTDRSGKLEIPMESTLRPRDIQTRIRAGETPEAVAEAAGSSVEKIMPFAAPVLAERAHVAERAQLSSVRRRTADSGARTLGEAVAAHLRTQNVDPESVEWDAWRREDGRWTLTGAFSAGGRTGTATYSYDARGNFVTVDDEDARWLVGDGGTTPDTAVRPAGDDLAAARQRRLSAVSPDELPLGEDTIEMVGDPEATDEPHPAETTLELSVDQPLEAFLDEAPDTGTTGQEPSGRPDPAAAEPEQPAAEEQPAKRPARRRGRASVPSWDEIMFGGGKGD